MKRLRFIMPIGILVAIAGFSAIVMLLWNWLVPAIFGLAVISFWQALGLLVLSHILFGTAWKPAARGIHRHGGFERNPIREKWEKMTLEERKEFIKKRHCEHGWHRHDFEDDFLNSESQKEE
ncbi:MAG: hypothetical protein LBV69_05985 [Bacteroidales bacterium]|jgi:hypothetical protein|nr:hypothetical protein [Bacteroidales bacterium]